MTSLPRSPDPLAASGRSPRAVDVAVVGTVVADILVRPVPLGEPIGAGRLFHVDPIEVTTGGIVCNSGIGLARLGLTVAGAGIVGADPWGDLIRRKLAAAGLDVVAIETLPTAATSTTAVLIDPTGERSFAHHVGACGAQEFGHLRDAVILLHRGAVDRRDEHGALGSVWVGDNGPPLVLRALRAATVGALQFPSHRRPGGPAGQPPCA